MHAQSSPPNSIGPFVVLRVLGEGSMGVVYAGYDVDLDRKVALKLVHRQLVGKPQARARMLKEAQALARLSSPFVVQVYQVGEHRDGSIYLAMEYIDGQTLRAWLKERRPWQVVLRTICDAGRGLAAAHAAGLVHRDFKPENVLIGGDGRPHVLDFGLVITEGAEDDEPISVAALEHESFLSTLAAGATPVSAFLGQEGPRRVVGTPAYMSPEQHRGEAVSPASDVYALAVTLYEGLYGVRPFSGASWDEIREKVMRGAVPPPPADSKVPRRIFRALARGLAVEPADRWPSVHAMLAALEREPRRARLQIASVVAALGIGSIASYSVAITQMAAASGCEIAADGVAEIWNDRRREALGAAFRGTAAPFADDALGRVEARLDSYAGELAAAQRALCEAEGAAAATARLLDLRSICLGRRRSRLSELVAILVKADRATVENAVQAVADLPSVRSCGDDERLLADHRLPEDPAVAARVNALREELSRVESMESFGHFEAGLGLVREIRGAARPLGFAPLEAETALREGSLLLAAGRMAEAVTALDRALRTAIVEDLHEVAAEAAARQIFAVGEGLGRYSDALATAAYAEALVERAPGDGSRTFALLYNNLGSIHDLNGDDATARAEYEKTIEILSDDEVRDAEAHPLLAITYHNLGGMALDQGDFDAAALHFRRGHEIFAATLGEHHPLAAHPLVGLGDVAFERGDLHDAFLNYSRALGVMEESYGADHIYLIDALVGLGNLALLDDPEAAAVHFTRAQAICERHHARYPALGGAFEGLGQIALAEGRGAEALGYHTRAAEVYAASSGHRGWLYARASLRAGRVASALGDRSAAITWFERVLSTGPSPRSRAVRAEASLLLARESLAGAKADEAAIRRACALLDDAAELAAGGALADDIDRERARDCPLTP